MLRSNLDGNSPHERLNSSLSRRGSYHCRYLGKASRCRTGTVYDTKSKLTWQQTVSSTTYAWADAKTYCAGVGTSLGGTGWRLPTIKELQSIVDLSQATGPYIDPNAFPSTPSNWFWSSTPLAGSPSDAWLVAFNLGDTSNYAVSFVYNVCCVR